MLTQYHNAVRRTVERERSRAWRRHARRLRREAEQLLAFKAELEVAEEQIPGATTLFLDVTNAPSGKPVRVVVDKAYQGTWHVYLD